MSAAGLLGPYLVTTSAGIITVKVAIRVKQDVGGTCPDPAYECCPQNSGDNCCCENSCCWGNCRHDKPGGPIIPDDCLPPGAWWEHEDGYSRAYMNISATGDKFDCSLHFSRL